MAVQVLGKLRGTVIMPVDSEQDAVVAEAKDLVSRGYKEIMLLGQNVNSYGAGLEEKVNFSELLRRIDAIDGDYYNIVGFPLSRIAAALRQFGLQG